MARRYRSQQPDLITSFVLTVGHTIWTLISWPFRRRGGRLDRDNYLDHWNKVQELVADRSEQHWQQAVVEADKLLDQAFRELLLPGLTLGERLRAAEYRFSRDTYQRLWQAHKLRNQISHEVGYTIDQHDAETAVSAFGEGLRVLGAL